MASTLDEESDETFYPVPVDYDGPIPNVDDDFYYLEDEDFDSEPAGVVTSVIYKDEHRFKDIVKQRNDGFLILYPNPDEISLFLGIRSFTHCEELRMKIAKYKEDEWEFEFYAL